MRTLGLLSGVALIGGGLALPAAAQTQAPPLTYAQPLPRQSVEAVQHRLAEVGAYRGRADGVWGPDSEAALQQFQSRHGLLVTGQLNPATAKMLGLDPAALLGTEQQTAAAPAPEGTLSPEAVRTIQRRLGQLGFYRGGVDGVWGPETQQAIARFQQSRGLQPNSQLNPATVAALGLSPQVLATR